jgi:hypothetical protein
MPRTVINLDPKDKAWLDREAKVRRVSMTELVRQAVRAYRIRQESLDRPNLQQVLARTGGIWRSGDGLAYQRRLREEWDRRS